MTTELVRLTEAERERWVYNDPESDFPILYAEQSVERLIATRVSAARVYERERFVAQLRTLASKMQQDYLPEQHGGGLDG